MFVIRGLRSSTTGGSLGTKEVVWSRPAAADVGPFAGPVAVAAEVGRKETKRHKGGTIWMEATAAVSLRQPVQE